jgi:2-polyprenyl-3-methyl-5-hydroxy-6-metoxy-1,4-benzoquinol methylase
MSSFNDSYTGLRHDLIQYIEGSSLTILDVGCATGVNGSYLLDKGIATQVVGIEYDPAMAEVAQEKNTYVFCGDLNLQSFRDKIYDSNRTYDVILMGDILEHLYDPWKLLRELREHLAVDGKIIISIPNIQHIELFIQVYLRGRWPRNERGIFDKTHLRWFTKKDAFSLVQQAGLQVLQYEPTYRSRDAIGSQFDWKYNIIKFLNPHWSTFQHKLICTHDI